MNDRNEDPGQIKLPDHTHPSDYSDVHPRTYDPEFISQISSKMQVPHRIGVGSDVTMKENGFVHQELAAATQFVGMAVPDRIVLAVEDKHKRKDMSGMINVNYESPVNCCYPQYPDMSIPYKLVLEGKGTDKGTGDDHHIALKQDLNLQLDHPSTSYTQSDNLSYVGLITPPRNITLEERFPVIEETDDQKMMAAHGGDPGIGHRSSSGHIGGFTVPYVPGVNLHDPVLLNEENESTLLRTQVAKLTRRVQVIEQDNQKRANRELVMYPVILSYFLWKIIGWFTRDR